MAAGRAAGLADGREPVLVLKGEGLVLKLTPRPPAPTWTVARVVLVISFMKQRMKPEVTGSRMVVYARVPAERARCQGLWTEGSSLGVAGPFCIRSALLAPV